MTNPAKNKFKEKIYAQINNQINNLEDETALQMLQEAVAAYSSPPKKHIVDKLTEEQRKRLKESIRQADEGKTYSNDVVKQKAREWLFI